MGNFILEIPKWQGEILFTKNFIEFIIVILLLIIGLLFCIRGYKYFHTIVLMAVSCILFYIGFLLAELLTGNMIIQMVISIILGIFGVCMLFFLSVIANFLIEKIHIKHFINKNMFIFTALFGAFLFSGTIYAKVYRNMIVAVILFILLGSFGLLIQNKNKEKHTQFRTYDDLYKMKPLAEKE